MKKKLNIDTIANELEGASLFFKKSATPSTLPESDNSGVEKNVPNTPPSTEATSLVEPVKIERPLKEKVEQPKNTTVTRSRDTTIPRHHETTVSRYHGIMIP